MGRVFVESEVWDEEKGIGKKEREKIIRVVRRDKSNGKKIWNYRICIKDFGENGKNFEVLT